MTRRDLVAEAKTRWNRLDPSAERWRLVSRRLYALLNAAEVLEDEDDTRWDVDGYTAIGYVDELRRLVSVGLVACIEGYFRVAYRDLIECSPVVRKRLVGLDHIEFDLKAYVGLELQNVKLSELIAHQLPARSIAQIKTTMGVLTESDFLRDVKAQIEATRQPVLLPEWDEPQSPVVLAVLDELFELRHIVAHEIARGERDYSRRTIRLARRTLDFLAASEHVVQQHLRQASSTAR